MSEALRVLFVHGLQSSPQGTKAQALAQRFCARTPDMAVSDLFTLPPEEQVRRFEACVAQQAAVIADFQPQVLVGSSFGGAVAVALLKAGLWSGPTLLLAPAARKVDPEASLKTYAPPIWIVHGVQDEVIPVEQSRALAATGDPTRIRLLELEDGHRLLSLVESGRLFELIEELATAG